MTPTAQTTETSLRSPVRVTVNRTGPATTVQANTAGSGRSPTPKDNLIGGFTRRVEDHPARLSKRRNRRDVILGIRPEAPTTIRVARTPDVDVMYVPTLSADQIPRWMADDDHRGRVVELRELCKQWAHTDHAHRAAMIKTPPRRYRWWHRFTARRHDLCRIAAVVHALCDRDDVAVPDWVWIHRSRQSIGLINSLDPESDYGRVVLVDAPAACAYHRVWFDPSSIENITVHGFRY